MSYDPETLVWEARISERYRFAIEGRLEEDEAMRCVTAYGGSASMACIEPHPPLKI